MSSSQFQGTFSLSLTKAMRNQLIDDMAHLGVADFDIDNISQLQERPGVYEIFLEGELVYVGKASKSIRERLGVHLKKLRGRESGLNERCAFKVLYVDEDLNAFGPEFLLIKGMKQAGKAPWNFNGFGNKDPGKQRDTTLVKENHFDALFPIDLGLEVLADVTADTKLPLSKCLTALKRELPFTFRFAKRVPTAEVDPPKNDRTASHWFRSVIQALPEGWMITALPGYVILYQESDVHKYESRTRTWRKVSGVVEDVPNSPQLEPGDPEDEPEVEGLEAD